MYEKINEFRTDRRARRLYESPPCVSVNVVARAVSRSGTFDCSKNNQEFKQKELFDWQAKRSITVCVQWKSMGGPMVFGCHSIVHGKTSSFVFCREKNKWWKIFHFRVNYPIYWTVGVCGCTIWDQNNSENICGCVCARLTGMYPGESKCVSWRIFSVSSSWPRTTSNSRSPPPPQPTTSLSMAETAHALHKHTQLQD